jgi:hypothetical protein
MNSVTLKSSASSKDQQIGVFISHSSSDANFAKLTDYFTERKIVYLSDSFIPAGDRNYNDRIKTMLHNASGGVLMLTPQSVASHWVMYEMGMLVGMNKPVIIYYEGEESQAKAMLPVFLRGYPIIGDISVLAEKISANTIFGDIFEYETDVFTKKLFYSKLARNIQTLIFSVSFTDDGGESVNINPDAVKFGYILLRLARQGILLADTEKCRVTNETRTDGHCTLCEDDNVSCACRNDVQCTTETPETIILNKILFLSAFYGSSVEYVLPIHKLYGVTFKCFVDIKDISQKNIVFLALQKAGMEDVTYSDSGEDQRIYFLLPAQFKEGLFVVREHGSDIVNNYFCLGSFSGIEE